MAKKSYDESKVLAQLKREWDAEIDFRTKVVRTPLGAPLSIHICGKIDFLEHYCGWRWATYTKAKKSENVKKSGGKKTKKTNKYNETDD